MKDKCGISILDREPLLRYGDKIAGGDSNKPRSDTLIHQASWEIRH